MKILYSLFTFLFISITSRSQQPFYIYLETDNGSTFYVQLADKILSSNAAGYLIIPELSDSTYNILIGTNASGLVTTRYSIKLNGSDKGYIIKTRDNNVELYDLKSLSVIKPLGDVSKKSMAYEKRTDDFTRLLSKSASDPSLLFIPVEAKQEPKKQEDKVATIDEKPEIKKEDQHILIKNSSVKEDVARLDTTLKASVTTVSARKMEDSVVASNSTRIKEDTKRDTIKTVTLTERETVESEKQYVRSRVKKHSESSTTEGFGLVYFDTYGEKTDTIQIIIPNPRIHVDQTEGINRPNEVLPNERKAADETKKPEIKSDTSSVASKSTTDSLKGEKVTIKSGNIIKPVATVCKTVATENDFFRIRKNMAARTSDESMVDEAKKFFKRECFTTEQIRSLSTLFLTSSGKYQLFDAAYMHVTDKEQFSSLQSEIRDEYYLKRFKALIGE